ncbi:MAG: hypothetical protein ACREC5_05330 [Thermoplasmata archaeon]
MMTTTGGAIPQQEDDERANERANESVKCTGCGVEYALQPGDWRARCPCGTLEVWESAWGTTAGAGYCDTTGAHLDYYHALGCRRHSYHGRRIGDQIGRYCPQGCDWSRELGDAEED